MEILKNLETKYVAYLDVLGFKELVIAKSEKLDSYYSTIIESLKGISFNNIDHILISDSIILSCENKMEDLISLLEVIQLIQTNCALLGIWIRGAISIGDIYINKEEKIVVGNGLIKAYLLESQAKYPRVIIDPKIIKDSHGTGQKFIQTLNNNLDESQKRIPLVVNSLLGKESDAFFVAFAEKIFHTQEKDFNLDNAKVFDLDNLNTIYLNVKSELYNSYEHYSKYLWLKNYFNDSILQMKSPYVINDPHCFPEVADIQAKFAEL